MINTDPIEVFIVHRIGFRFIDTEIMNLEPFVFQGVIIHIGGMKNVAPFYAIGFQRFLDGRIHRTD